MNKQEAIQAMQQGKRVTHRDFDPNEWMTMKDGMMILEDDVIFPAPRLLPEEFWKWRTDPRWDDGYEVFES